MRLHELKGMSRAEINRHFAEQEQKVKDLLLSSPPGTRTVDIARAANVTEALVCKIRKKYGIKSVAKTGGFHPRTVSQAENWFGCREDCLNCKFPDGCRKPQNLCKEQEMAYWISFNDGVSPEKAKAEAAKREVTESDLEMIRRILRNGKARS